MAIDKTLLDSIVGGYKYFIDDLNNRNITGEHADEVRRLFNRIQELGEECSDMNALYAKMQNENITVKMSDAYTRALTEESQKNHSTSDGNIPDDSAMMKNNVDALRNSIKAIRDNFDNLLNNASPSERMRIMVEHDPQPIIKPIEDLIALAEKPGMTYAKFLRLQIERGLDKITEGTTTHSFIENVLNTHKALMSPPIVIQLWEEKLERYNTEAAKNKFNIVDLHQWELISDSIERKYEPLQIRQQRIFDMFMKILGDLDLWCIAYCPYTPHELAPWNTMPYPEAMQDLKRIQKTTPGILKEYEKLLYRYFNLRLKDIIKDELFLHHIKSNMIDESQELVEFLLIEVYPQCKPFNDLSNTSIDKRVEMHRGKRESNPGRMEPYFRLKKHYNSIYGEGYMEKFMKEQNLEKDDVKEYSTPAAPWDIDSFWAHTNDKIEQPI